MIKHYEKPCIDDNIQRSINVRKRRVLITTEKLNIFIRMRNAGEKVSSISSALDVTKQTVYKIFGKMHKQDKNNERYGNIMKKTKWSKYMVHVAEVVQMDNTLTQKGMQDKLRSMDVILVLKINFVVTWSFTFFKYNC